MDKSNWQLKSIVFPHFYCAANADHEAASRTDDLPKLEVNAYTVDASEFSVNMSISWGASDKTAPYDISLGVFASFSTFQKSNLQDEKETKRALDVIMEHRLNALHIMYSSARDHLLTVSARGPWGAVLLPMLIFDAKDCPLHVGDEIAELLKIKQSSALDATKAAATQ